MLLIRGLGHGPTAGDFRTFRIGDGKKERARKTFKNVIGEMLALDLDAEFALSFGDFDIACRRRQGGEAERKAPTQCAKSAGHGSIVNRSRGRRKSFF